MTYTDDLYGWGLPTLPPPFPTPITGEPQPYGPDHKLYHALIDHHLKVTGSYPSGEERAGFRRRVIESRRA